MRHHYSSLISPTRPSKKWHLPATDFPTICTTSYSLVEHCILSAGRLHLATSAFVLALRTSHLYTIPSPFLPKFITSPVATRYPTSAETSKPTLTTTILAVYIQPSSKQSFFSCLSFTFLILSSPLFSCFDHRCHRALSHMQQLFFLFCLYPRHTLLVCVHVGESEFFRGVERWGKQRKGE